MAYKFVVGKISAERAENWFCENDNPYTVCDGKYLIDQICYVNSWCIADGFLRDRVSVDWGSFAWRANRRELADFFNACRWDVSQVQALDPDTDYAVIFIESAGEF